MYTAQVIGLLDIFGFENFEKNSFEQLCINLANENLQFFFNEHIFKQELAEYKREGLASIDVSYVDNGPILELFTGKPLSVLILLNEESKLRSSSAKTLGAKLRDHVGKHKAIKITGKSFTVEHYAGSVEYELSGMIEKNRDELPDPVLECFQASTRSLIARLFSGGGGSSSNPPAPSAGAARGNAGRASRRFKMSFKMGRSVRPGRPGNASVRGGKKGQRIASRHLFPFRRQYTVVTQTVYEPGCGQH